MKYEFLDPIQAYADLCHLAKYPSAPWFDLDFVTLNTRHYTGRKASLTVR